MIRAKYMDALLVRRVTWRKRVSKIHITAKRHSLENLGWSEVPKQTEIMGDNIESLSAQLYSFCLMADAKRNGYPIGKSYPNHDE